MRTHSLAAAILGAVMQTSLGVTGAAPIFDSDFNADIQHGVWAVRDRALQRADNLSVPESILLQLYRPATTSNQVDPVEDSTLESTSFRALAAPTTAPAEPAFATTLLSEPAPFALLIAALGGLFLRRRK